MNHLQMFKEVQEDTLKYSYEMRSLMKHINNEINLEKMRTELNLLVKFTEQKIIDSNVLLGLPSYNGNQLYLEGEQ